MGSRFIEIDVKSPFRVVTWKRLFLLSQIKARPQDLVDSKIRQGFYRVHQNYKGIDPRIEYLDHVKVNTNKIFLVVVNGVSYSISKFTPGWEM